MKTNTKKAVTKDTKKFQNKYGYFTADGREFVFTRPDTPRPWANVVCNADYGFINSQTGGGFSWIGNSQLSRVTRWEQDLIRDEWGKYIYVRDKDTSKFWSVTWKPCCVKFDSFETRYGQGYTLYKTAYQGIQHELLQFVPTSEPVEIWKLTVTNQSKKVRNLSFFSYFEWCLGNANDTHREFQKTFIETEIDSKNNAIYGRKRPALVPRFISSGLSETPVEAFHALTNVKAKAFDGDKESFFGQYGNILAPASVTSGKLKGADGRWGDATASIQADVTLKPGESKVLVFILGATKSREEGIRLIKKYSTLETVERALQEVREYWEQWIDDCWVETPDEALNFLTNIWYKYQTVSARIWGRTAYYQCSGGFGFRDQLQDSHVWLPWNPKLTKNQILLHAEQQFPDGTVYHWWHPNTNIGAHTEMSDDLLWLVFLTLAYIDETNDFSILKEKAPFVQQAGKPKEVGTLYDHCKRAIDKVLSRFSERGLPLIGEGDWNDGMSHVGINWKGESVWLGHFLYGILQRFAPLCEREKEPQVSANYLKRAEAVKKAINEHAWDGEWYIRATRDDGRPLGSKSEKEGKIFLNAQTWAVICGTATLERAKKAMASAEKLLFQKYGPLLFAPAYTVTDPTIGYLSRYAAGIRENGGVYTHAATWGVQAECIMGKGDKAYQAYKNMCPIYRATDDADHYFVEPYATPGNVDGPDSPNFGRGGWTWYSGSGAWMFKVAYDWICGIRAAQEGLVIDPCIPHAWKGFRAKRQFRGATYLIEVENPEGVCSGVVRLELDGKVISGKVIPAQKGGEHRVRAVLGKAASLSSPYAEPCSKQMALAD
jgi:cellobiose phosphorylase